MENRQYIRNFYIENSLLKPMDLMDAYAKPEFTEFLALQHIGFSYLPQLWNKRNAYYSEDERVICAVSGSERFAMASPVFSQNLYVGLFEEFKIDFVPVDLFETDLEEYPLTKDAKI